MQSPATLDFSSLLAPIPGDNPAGDSLRYTGLYDAVEKERHSDDGLSRGPWQREVKTADWSAVIQLTTEALANKSKDLQLAVRLVEALVKRCGFAGLRDGIRLLRELQEKFWDKLYPQIEDGDLTFRAGPIVWLNEKLPPSILVVPLTRGEMPYAWHHWKQSREAVQTPGTITAKQFDESVAETVEKTPLFYQNLLDDLDQTRAELIQLEKIVDEKFGQEPPSLLNVRKAVHDCHDLVDGLVKKQKGSNGALKLETEPATDPDATRSSDACGNQTTWTLGKEPCNRDEAFQQLAAIAAYLRRVEPQHPTSYLLDRAVRWTRMPLDQWLGEVISNHDVLNHLRETLGIKNG